MILSYDLVMSFSVHFRGHFGSWVLCPLLVQATIRISGKISKVKLNKSSQKPDDLNKPVVRDETVRSSKALPPWTASSHEKAVGEANPLSSIILIALVGCNTRHIKTALVCSTGWFEPLNSTYWSKTAENVLGHLSHVGSQHMILSLGGSRRGRDDFGSYMEFLGLAILA